MPAASPSTYPTMQRCLTVIAAIAALGFLATGDAAAHEVPAAVYSAASLDREQPVAPNSIAIVDGEFGDRTTTAPDGQPQAELDSFTVAIQGFDGTTVAAPIFEVAPRQLRFLLPNVPAGTAHIEVKRGSDTVSDGQFQVRTVSPGLFSAAGSGGGLADAQAVIVDLVRGTRLEQDAAYLESSDGTYRPVPLNPAAEGAVLFLRLRGTGIRYASEVDVSIGGVDVPANCRSEGGLSAGLDEVQVGPLPVQLAHRELVEVVLTADGHTANTVQVSFTSSTGAAVTFSNQISRLFQQNCQECHRPGEVAPFSLIEYAAAAEWAEPIKDAVARRYMPPWKPVPGHGEFMGERRLADEEIEMIAAWVDAGAPEGDPRDLPDPLQFDSDWSLGTPDLVLETPVYTPDPNVNDDYRCFSVALPESITESKSITGIEIRPGNRKIVHHLILFGDPLGESRGLEQASTDGLPGYECFGSANISPAGFTWGVESYFMGGWAPGARPQLLPDGSGVYLRRGSRIAIQLHYHPDGTEQSDTTRIGLHFADERTPRNASVLMAINTSFQIPPGAERHEVAAEFNFQRVGEFLIPDSLRSVLESSGLFPLDIINVLPHMHLLGKEIRMDKVSASGETTPMVYIDDWDFDWQDFYTYKEPMKLHLDDRLVVRASYDNSSNNPHNPNNPPIPVGWGESTTDEMCIVFFTLDIPDLCQFPLGLCDSH